MARTEHEREILKEKKRLQGIFEGIPENKKETVAGLIENAAFLRYELKRLQADILENGAVVSAMTGNGYQKDAENPALKNYTALCGRYNNITRLLLSLLPEDDDADELEEYL